MTSPQIKITGSTPGEPVPIETHVDTGPHATYRPKSDDPLEPDYQLMMGDDFPGA